MGVLAGRVRHRLSERVLNRLGISIPEWRVLLLVGEAGVRTAGDLVGMSDMDHVTIHRAVTRLCAAGLLHRAIDPDNRRQKLLWVADPGEAVLAEAIPVAYEIEAELLAGLSREEAATLRRLLRRLMARPRPTLA
jgi:DNA-binding MarR family transcriptional regulator